MASQGVDSESVDLMDLGCKYLKFEEAWVVPSRGTLNLGPPSEIIEEDESFLVGDCSKLGWQSFPGFHVEKTVVDYLDAVGIEFHEFLAESTRDYFDELELDVTTFTVGSLFLRDYEDVIGGFPAIPFSFDLSLLQWSIPFGQDLQTNLVHGWSR
jgi:hypothetical protein